MSFPLNVILSIIIHIAIWILLFYATEKTTNWLDYLSCSNRLKPLKLADIFSKEENVQVYKCDSLIKNYIEPSYRYCELEHESQKKQEIGDEIIFAYLVFCLFPFISVFPSITHNYGSLSTITIILICLVVSAVDFGLAKLLYKISPLKLKRQFNSDFGNMEEQYTWMIENLISDGFSKEEAINWVRRDICMGYLNDIMPTVRRRYIVRKIIGFIITFFYIIFFFAREYS